MLGGSYSGMDHSLGRSVVAMFVAGLTELKQCKLFVPEFCKDQDIALLHLFFESQNEFLTTRMLGNEVFIRNVCQFRPTPHDAYVLGCCISLSRCRWMLMLYYLRDEHIDLMKQAIDSRRYAEGRIIRVDFRYGTLTSNGIGQLLSLPHNTLSDLRELYLSSNELGYKCCEMLARCLSSLPRLESSMFGTVKLTVMVHTCYHNLFAPTLQSESFVYNKTSLVKEEVAVWPRH